MGKIRADYKDPYKYENIEISNVKILDCINPEAMPKDRRFNAICKCGEKRTVRQYAIVHQKKLQCKSCGWKQLGIKKQKPEAGLNNLYLHYVKASERREIEFKLDKKTVKQITSSNCHYCGKPPELLSFSARTWDNRSQYIYNTIDRINSNIGYFKENCVPSCKQCNIAKASMSTEEYISFIKRVYKFQEKKNG